MIWDEHKFKKLRQTMLSHFKGAFIIMDPQVGSFEGPVVRPSGFELERVRRFKEWDVFLAELNIETVTRECLKREDIFGILGILESIDVYPATLIASERCREYLLTFGVRLTDQREPMAKNGDYVCIFEPTIRGNLLLIPIDIAEKILILGL